MTKPVYEKVTTDNGNDYIKRTTADGVISFIPVDEANADYQAYLNPVEHLTENVPANE